MLVMTLIMTLAAFLFLEFLQIMENMRGDSVTGNFFLLKIVLGHIFRKFVHIARTKIFRGDIKFSSDLLISSLISMV